MTAIARPIASKWNSNPSPFCKPDQFMKSPLGMCTSTVATSMLQKIPKAAMHLSNGKDFTMTAENLSDENIYVQSVRLNGRNWDSPFLPYQELKNGGKIAFKMGPQPSRWGTNPVLPE